MANEAVLIVATQPPIPFTVADGAGLEKGTLLKISDPRTVAAADGITNYIGGILAEEKIASDGLTQRGVYRGGIFKVTASGSIAVGDLCGFYENNQVYSISALQTISTSGSRVAGIALETAADTETFLFELNICGMGEVA